MSKGANLSYWNDNVSVDKQQKALFVRDNVNSPWLLVGIYEAGHLKKILSTTYANWPNTSIHIATLP